MIKFIYHNFGVICITLGVIQPEKSSGPQTTPTNKLSSLIRAHTHTQTHSKRYKKQCMGPDPISTSRCITLAGEEKKKRRRQ